MAEHGNAIPTTSDWKLRRSDPIDGFQQAFIDRQPDNGPGGDAPTVLLLHGWPGDSREYRHVLPLIDDRCESSFRSCAGSVSPTGIP